MKIRLPDSYIIYGEKEQRIDPAKSADVRLDLHLENDVLTPCIEANETPLCYVVLRWMFREDERRRESIRILGDYWERAYGDMEWKGIVPERCMPWYCLVSNGSDSNLCTEGRRTECFGVKVRPSSLAFWQYDDGGVTLTLDIRCGGRGVILGGRTLNMAEVIFADYRDVSAYQSGKLFCKEMCSDPIFPKEPLYGFNNWYYAYGVSSAEEIKRDAAKLAECAKGLSTRPFMVIDDCWQPNRCDGPWDRGNEKFPDMKRLAEEISEMGVDAGIWLRPLCQCAPSDIPSEWRLERNWGSLDPSRKEVLDYVKLQFSRLVEWGYKLIKFDFVTYDLNGKWGRQCPTFLMEGDWSFYDRSKTSAEIILDLYRAIREGAGEALLIGCNAVSHLCAGLVEINRIGNDTSGRWWNITRRLGVNTLAFRSMQNGTFYVGDADCVGLTDYLPWDMNRKWMYLLARSGSPMLISWDPVMDTEEIRAEVCEALRVNSIQTDELFPVDWMENNCPRVWSLNGEIIEFDWFESHTNEMIERKY